MLSLSSWAEPLRCSSRALKLLLLRFSPARFPSLRLRACSVVCSPATQALLGLLYVSYMELLVQKFFRPPFGLPGITILFPSIDPIRDLRQKLFSFTAPPTNFSRFAVLRESAAASPRFAYALILTLPPRVSQNTPTQISRLIDALPSAT